MSAWTQQTVSGTVIDAQNVPVPGVSVVIKGTAIGTITDVDGNFSIQANPDDILVFSFIGMESQEISVGNQTILYITMRSALFDLEEVVVMGYGVQKKKLSTGATVQVKGDDIQRMNTTSALQAIQGQTPGVTISSTSGQPGSDMKVTIRGLGTIGNSGPPIYNRWY